MILLLLIFNVFAINAQTSERESVARAWIVSHSNELGIKPYHNFKLSFVRKSLSGETLRFQQMLNNNALQNAKPLTPENEPPKNNIFTNLKILVPGDAEFKEIKK